MIMQSECEVNKTIDFGVVKMSNRVEELSDIFINSYNQACKEPDEEGNIPTENKVKERVLKVLMDNSVSLSELESTYKKLMRSTGIFANRDEKREVKYSIIKSHDISTEAGYCAAVKELQTKLLLDERRCKHSVTNYATNNGIEVWKPKKTKGVYSMNKVSALREYLVQNPDTKESEIEKAIDGDGFLGETSENFKRDKFKFLKWAEALRAVHNNAIHQSKSKA